MRPLGLVADNSCHQTYRSIGFASDCHQGKGDPRVKTIATAFRLTTETHVDVFPALVPATNPYTFTSLRDILETPTLPVDAQCSCYRAQFIKMIWPEGFNDCHGCGAEASTVVLIFKQGRSHHAVHPGTGVPKALV